MQAPSLYIVSDSPVHRADARAKLVLLLVYSVGLLFVGTWWGMAVAAALLLGAFVAARLPVRPVFLVPAPAYVLVAVTVAFNAFSYGPDAGMAFSAAGLSRGCLIGVRICLLVWASLIVCYATTSTQLVAAFLWFLRPLRAVRVPVDDVAMALSIALRFIPLIAVEYDQIRDAQWARGAAFDEGGPVRRIRAHVAILLPLIVGLFRRADRLAEAMDARCHGLKK